MKLIALKEQLPFFIVIEALVDDLSNRFKLDWSSTFSVFAIQIRMKGNEESMLIIEIAGIQVGFNFLNSNQHLFSQNISFQRNQPDIATKAIADFHMINQ